MMSADLYWLSTDSAPDGRPQTPHGYGGLMWNRINFTEQIEI
jgi:hypothetical protein